MSQPRPTPVPAGVTPEQPGPGQESVWSYPRPPAVRRTGSLVEVVLGDTVIASTRDAYEVLETSHPPTVYLPMQDFVEGALRDADGGSYCEWKGMARYHDLVGGDRVAQRRAWSYPDPVPAYAMLRDHVALYPAAVDECRVDGEVVRAQPGTFYGGWVTDAVVGPFKGEPGSQGW